MAIVGRMDFLKVQLYHQFHRQSTHVFDLKERKGEDILKSIGQKKHPQFLNNSKLYTIIFKF